MGLQLQIFILVIVLGILGVGVTNLVLTILIRNDQSTSVTSPISTRNPHISTDQGTTKLPTKSPATKPPVSKTKGFKDAATQLLRGLDPTVDPCEDFYAFTCNTYLKNIVIPPDASRIGTYDEAQEKVFGEIIDVLEQLNITSVSKTERLTKYAYTKCLFNKNIPEQNKAGDVNKQLKNNLGDIPMFNENWKPISISNLTEVAGRWERDLTISTLFSAGVTANDGNSSEYALFLSHPNFALPLDYFIRPQYLNELEEYRQSMIDLFTNFGTLTNRKYTAQKIEDDVTKIVQLQVQLALDFIPNDLLKNARLQFNNYTINEFALSYPDIGRNYFDKLLKDIFHQPDKMENTPIIVTQPRYYRALDGILRGNGFEIRDFANYFAMQYIFANADFIGGQTQKIVKQIKVKKFQLRKKDYDDQKLECIETIQGLMPYGTGYIYLKYMDATERQLIVDDVKKQVEYVIGEFIANVDSLKWMTDAGKAAVHRKKEAVIKNIGYPWWFDFKDTTSLDQHHINYMGLEDEKDYYKLLNGMVKAFQKTENLGLLDNKTVDRLNFQDSPATVNAWYAPELNSITIPRAILNEPYYRIDFPQSYNYAGNGGTVGHEFTHGFDDDGVQYSGDGSLADCGYQFCSILDNNSTAGFLNMAQCVISQYSEKCCPLKTGNVHCANGENTQGENIADIGGQYAAYKAYRRYIEDDRNGKEEDLLPGLENFTGNQIFWITYGFSWCMKQTDDNLWRDSILIQAHQLLTNEHAPGSCRVNQVLQDLPEFARDFACKPKTSMAPTERCNVWRR